MNLSEASVYLDKDLAITGTAIYDFIGLDYVRTMNLLLKVKITGLFFAKIQQKNIFGVFCFSLQ